MSGGESNPPAIRGRYGFNGTKKTWGWRKWNKLNRLRMQRVRGIKPKPRHKLTKEVTLPEEE